MLETKPAFRAGNEGFDLVADLRSNVQGMGGDAREFWGETIYRSMVSDAKQAVERAWDNKDASAFLSVNGNTRQAMRHAVASGNYNAAFKSIPPLPFSNVYDPKTVYQAKPVATNRTQIEADNPRETKASLREVAPESVKAKSVFTSVREAAAAYRDKLIAAAPELQRAAPETQRQRSAMRPR